jgi:hypothetical protein
VAINEYAAMTTTDEVTTNAETTTKTRRQMRAPRNEDDADELAALALNSVHYAGRDRISCSPA